MIAIALTLISVPSAQASSSERESVVRDAVSPANGSLTDGRSRSERCRSARIAAAYFRYRTWSWQELREGKLATRSPIVAGKSCHWAKFAAAEWQARASSARRSFYRWFNAVGVVVRHLERGLRGTPMQGTGAILEREGREHGISPFFMVATAATESSLGRAACPNNRFNVWGLAACDGRWHVPYFRSWDEAISFYAEFLNERWPHHSTPYSFTGYAACDSCWGGKVASWMSALFGVPARTRYP